jgi:hypothetical protein
MPKARNIASPACGFEPFRRGAHQVWARTRVIEENKAMIFGSGLAGLAVALIFGTCPALAEECPAKSSQMDDVIEAIKGSPGCDAAMKVFEACEYGASGDVQFGAAVQEKCEADFLSRLKAPQKQAYQRQMRVCDRKYRTQSGTMYLSFTAFYRAELAQNYAHKQQK